MYISLYFECSSRVFERTNSLAVLALFESFLRIAEHTKPVTKTKPRETQISS